MNTSNPILADSPKWSVLQNLDIFFVVSMIQILNKQSSGGYNMNIHYCIEHKYMIHVHV